MYVLSTVILAFSVFLWQNPEFMIDSFRPTGSVGDLVCDIGVLEDTNR